MQQGTLRLVSWNIGNLYLNSDFLQDLIDDLFDRYRNIPNIARTCNLLQPDIILLQEVPGREYLTELESQLTLSYNSFLGPQMQSSATTFDTTRHLGCLFDKSIPLMSIQSLPEQRAWQGDILLAGQALRIINVHGNCYDAGKRQEDITTLLQEHAPGRTVIAGDFNLQSFLYKNQEDQMTLKQLTEHGFVDTTADIKKTSIFQVKLDYVFIRGITAFSYCSKNRFGLMDHYPIVSILQSPV